MATIIAAPPRSITPPEFGGGEGGRRRRFATQRTGMLLTLASISMMFIGLTSAYVVSQGLGPLWKQVHMRPLIWINTAILLSSSYTIERARRGLSMKWLTGTLLLGIAFVAGQIAVFSELAKEGLYLNTGRQASFYYLLTGLHALHVVAGILALGWTILRFRKSTLDIASMYWHFMDGLWIYLLVVIFI